MNPAKNRTATAALALAVVYLVWGSTYLAIRFSLEGGFPPLLMAGGRFLLAGVLVFLVLIARGQRMPTAMQWKNMAIIGALMMAVGNGLVCVAEQWVSSGLAAVAIASVPLWIALFSLMRGQRPTQLEWVGIGVGFIGVIWLNAGSSLTATPWGLAALAVAPIAWAYGAVWQRGRDLPAPFTSAGGQMLAAGALLIVAGLMSGERVAPMPTLKANLAVIYLVVFGSIFAFTAFAWLLQNVRPTLASSNAYVNPVVAVLLGAWLADEHFSAHDLSAIALILVGVVAICLSKAKPGNSLSPGLRTQVHLALRLSGDSFRFGREFHQAEKLQ